VDERYKEASAEIRAILDRHDISGVVILYGARPQPIFIGVRFNGGVEAPLDSEDPVVKNVSSRIEINAMSLVGDARTLETIFRASAAGMSPGTQIH
jgi:hypothetical protein